MRKLAKAALLNVEAFTETAWRRFANRLGFSQVRQIVAYIAYGNDNQVWVRGRVLANRPIRGPEAGDGWWDNLRATYERWETDEVAGAEVELIYGTQRRVVTTDEEGYYVAAFDRDASCPSSQVVIARSQSKDTTMAAQHQVMSIDPAAAFMIISDMDDTVIHTGITDLLMAARLTFLNNARTRKPLAGVAALYRALEKGCDGAARNPFFYVSNSGWNMYDLLKAFIELNDIPQGPLFLRDLGLNPAQRDSSNHKAHTIQMFLKKFPELPAVLIGDSGQHDAALYATIADTFPGRILAIYIRDVDPDHDSSHDAKVDAIFESHANSGLPMLRAGDSPAFARHMQRIGLLPRSVHQSIAAGVERDNNRD